MGNKRMKYLSLFTGIGGFDLPLRELGFECVGWSEIDKYAIKTFEANFPELKGKNIGDITKYNFTNITNIDLIVGGSSCQSFSISSNNRIGLDGVSGVFHYYIKALKILQPSWFIWENVKGVLSCRKDWQVIADSFNEAGYNFHYQILNSADYGIPQQRKRVFVVGQRKDLGTFNFSFPPKQNLKIFLKDIIVDGYTDRDISYTIDANYHKCSKSNPRAYFEDNKRQIVFKDGGGIRKLYTIECFRLQDFPDEFHNKAKKAGVSNTQLYKQAGNAVTVNVIRCILNSLFKGSNKTQLNLF